MKLRDSFFVRASNHIGITILTKKRVKIPKTSGIKNHIVLEGDNAIYDNFSIFVPKIMDSRDCSGT